MKNFTTIALSLMSLIQSSAMASGITLAPVPVNHVYAPAGFDSNDNSEIILSGYLPNLCYKAARAETKVSGRSIDIKVQALKSAGTVACLQMIVPFLESAPAGVLDKGTYAIQVNSTDTRRSSLKVVESTSPAIDDFVYAGVEYIERVPGTRRVLLKGNNPNTCFELDQIKLVSNGIDTYSVLPMLRRVSQICPEVLVPFSYEMEVPAELSESKILLHVRVMNGKSVNTLFDQSL